MILLDTGVLIAHFRAADKSKTWFYELAGNHNLGISAVTEYEFRIGFKDQKDLFLSQILAKVDILPFDSACVEESVLIYQNLRQRSMLIPVQDIFIAATAIMQNLSLATLNTNHFQRIQGLHLMVR